jgi:large subunit ribosomal protein L21
MNPNFPDGLRVRRPAGEAKLENRMYAIVESGGKQYVAREGSTVEVDRLPVEAGAEVRLDRVLLVQDDDRHLVGAPWIEGATVVARVVEQVLAPKVIVFRYIPKERFRRKRGHRQQYTRLAIETIEFPGGKKAEPAAAAERPAAPARKAAPGRKSAPAKASEAASSAKKPKARAAAPKGKSSK